MAPTRFLVAALTTVGALCSCAPSQGARGEQPGGDTLLAVNGTRLFVHREGAGEPVVVVHGGPLLDHGYLVEPLRPLGSAFELVFYDQRLSGRSDGEVDSASVRLDTMVADLEAIRRTLGLGRIHLLAHSWGGLLAMRYATLYGDGLRSLVLVNSTPPSAELWQEELQAQAAAIEPADTAGMGALRSSAAVAAGDPEAIEELLQRSFRPQLHDPSAAAGLDFHIPEDYAARSRQLGYLRPDLATFDLRDDLTAVRVPTLLVYGSDQVGWRIGRDALVSALPGSRDIAITDAGHFPFLEQPAEFRRVVREFLTGVGESRGSPEAGASDDIEQDTARLARLRREMVRRQIEGRGVGDPAVLRAMRAVPRHRFVPEAPPEAAYTDRPLPIGYGQTISQPYIVAFMAEAAAIEPGDRVLEIGTGSGYGAAVLAELADQVYTIEIVPELAERARGVLARTGYRNVEVRTGNGWLGWPEAAPFDAIVVTAAPDRVPEALERQLAVGGTLVIPVGDRVQTLRVLRKSPEGLREIASLPVRFVPMVGGAGRHGRVTELSRGLGAPDGAAVVVANVIGTGIFLTPAFIAGRVSSPGPYLTLWVVGGILAAVGALAYAELAAMRPRAGGEYVYIREAFGPLAGFLSGWTSLVAGFSGAIAAAAVGFAVYLDRLVPGTGATVPILHVPLAAGLGITVTPRALVALALITLFTLIHARGLGAGRVAQQVLAWLNVATIGLLVALGFMADPGGIPAAAPGVAAAASTEAAGPGDLLVALVLVMFTYSGWNAAAYVAGELREPGRTVPRALLWGTAIVTVLYLALNVLYVRVLGVHGMADAEATGDAMVRTLWGATGTRFLTPLILLVLASSVSAMVLTGPRVYFAMARDGCLPTPFARVPDRGVPTFSIAVQAAWSAVLVLTGGFEALLTYTGFAVVLFAGLGVAALFALRRRRPDEPRPFRAWGYPWAPALFVAAAAAMVGQSILRAPGPSLAGVGLMAAGVPVFLSLRRRAAGQPPVRD